MRKLVFVWHGHHQESSPLEEIRESFKDREDTINYTKSLGETPLQIERRKKLFKRVRGGLKALPKSFQAIVNRYIRLSKKESELYKPFLRAKGGSKEEVTAERAWRRVSLLLDKAKTAYYLALGNPTKGILALHAKQCGCGWTPENNNIFHYKP